jgi:hypothetical protein
MLINKKQVTSITRIHFIFSTTIILLNNKTMKKWPYNGKKLKKGKAAEDIPLRPFDQNL